MQVIGALLSFFADAVAWLLVTIFGAPVRADRHFTAPTSEPTLPSTDSVDDLSSIGLEVSRPPDYLQSRRDRERVLRQEEDDVSDSFLSQLEQRTQQVKITLANLEAEKIRIEGLITQLQPIVPHYDALLAAERQISEAQIAFDATGATPASSDSSASTAAQDGGAPTSWEQEHRSSESNTPSWGSTSSYNQ